MTPREQKLLPQSYTIEQIDSMAKEYPLGAFGMAMDARIRQFDKQQKLTFVEIGYICLKVEQTEAWREMYDQGKFKSFGAWITDAAPSSRATCYAAMGEVKRAIEDKLPLQQLNTIPRCNIRTVNRLSTELKRDPEILKAAETLEERDFLRKIEKEHPLEHVEDLSPMRFKFEKSQRQKVEEAIQVAMVIYELPTREAAMEVIAADWLNSNQTEADYQEAEKAMAAYVGD